MGGHANDGYNDPGSATQRAAQPQTVFPEELRTQQSPEQGGTAATENLDDLNVDELRDRAKAAGVEGYSSLKKDELVKALS